MHTVTVIYTRQSTDVPFFGSTDEGSTLNDRYYQLCKEEGSAFKGKDVIKSKNNLTLTVVNVWSTKKAFQDFSIKNKDELISSAILRNAYQTANDITRIVIKN